MTDAKSIAKETLPILRESYTIALEVGNLRFVEYGGNSFCLHKLCCGYPPATLEQDRYTYHKSLVKLNQVTAVNHYRIYWQIMLNLLVFAENTTLLFD
jgi:predicted ATPase